MTTQADVDAFHAHLNVCTRCANQPFNLCNTGKILIERTAPAPKMDWERHVTPTPLDTAGNELIEFAKFCKANPNGNIHVKRWNKTLRSYEFGFVIVMSGIPDPVVYVPTGLASPKHDRFAFDDIISLINERGMDRRLTWQNARRNGSH